MDNRKRPLASDGKTVISARHTSITNTAIPMSVRKDSLRQKVSGCMQKAMVTSAAKLIKRDYACMTNDKSEEALIFSALWHSCYLRKEFAHDMVRSAVVEIQLSPFYRQRVKQRANEVLRRLARWDSESARQFGRKADVADFYEEMAEETRPVMRRMYETLKMCIAQVLMRELCGQGSMVHAGAIAAMLTVEFVFEKIRRDVKEAYNLCPTTWVLGELSDDGLYQSVSELVNEMDRVVCPKDWLGTKVTHDPNVKQTAQNLMRYIGSDTQMTVLIDDYYAKIKERQQRQTDNDTEEE